MYISFTDPVSPRMFYNAHPHEERGRLTTGTVNYFDLVEMVKNCFRATTRLEAITYMSLSSMLCV